MSTEIESLVPPLPPGVTNLRNLDLFAQHSLLSSYESDLLKARHLPARIPAQFAGYNADNTTIVCLADLQLVTAYLKRIGRVPVALVPDAKIRELLGLEKDPPHQAYAVVNLVMNDYLDTSVGPYQAIMLSTFARRAGARKAELPSAAALALEQALPPKEWPSPFAAILPLLDPEVEMVIGPLAMSANPGAWAIGREKMGIRKYETLVRISHDQGSTSASVNTADTLRLSARVGEVTELEERESRAALLMQLGLFGSLDALLNQSRPVPHPFLGWDGQGGKGQVDDGVGGVEPAYSASLTLTRAKFRVWNGLKDSFNVVGGDELSDKIKEFALKPLLASRDAQISVVVEPDEAESAELRDKLLQPPKPHQLAAQPALIPLEPIDSETRDRRVTEPPPSGTQSTAEARSVAGNGRGRSGKAHGRDRSRGGS